jgi:predicted unusual protein kinase regulating ubiquinone biosynthesis (AarF/ABC1/UbiB family)
MSNMMALLAPMRLSGDWDNIRKQCDDIRVVVQRETDYVQEADFTRRARAVFTSEDRIVVPRIYDEYSTQRVLTMEYIDGGHLEEYLTTEPTQDERDRFGELLMRASFRIAHAAKIWYSDSSPGNYLFMKDGRLGLIDFGCCREFSEQEWDYYKLMERSYREGGEALRRALLVSVNLDPQQQTDSQYVDFLVDLADWYNGYLVHEGKFDFGNEEFIRRGMDLMAEIARKRYFRSLPVNTWIGRHLVGLRMIAHRLRARIDMKTICEEESQGIFY